MADIFLVLALLIVVWGSYRLGRAAGEVDALTNLNERRLP